MDFNKETIEILKKELSLNEEYCREDVYNLFEGFVSNKTQLREFVDFGILGYDYIKYKTLFQGTLYEEGINEIIRMQKEAHTLSSAQALSALQNGYNEVAKGFASYTQLTLALGPKIETNERADLFYKKAFHIIGDIIEGSLKPYIHYLNELRCIIENKDNKQAKLGDAVNSLICYSEVFSALYSNLLNDIPISQWRNIADHSDYSLIEEDVLVRYGSATNRKSRRFTSADIMLVLMSIDTLLYMHKTAFTLVSIDNYNLLDFTEILNSKSVFTRSDDAIAQIVETSAMYGFTVAHISCEGSSDWTVELEPFKDCDSCELELFLTILARIIAGSNYNLTISDKGAIKYKASYKDRELFILQVH